MEELTGLRGHQPLIPDIPGELLPDNAAHQFKEQVRALCGLSHTRFPGSQPVSFGTRDIDKLRKEDYWVCEKSDGIRVLVYICLRGDQQDVFLIDRHNKYRHVSGFYFPHHEHPEFPLRESLLDGELVLDKDRYSDKHILRLLIFDCLVLDRQNVMSKSLLKRTGRLKDHLFAPYEKMLREFPQTAAQQPFEIRRKPMQLSYHLQQVLEVEIPRLAHGNDGLIYTCASSGYVVGTDPRIMKWKPPSENSIDFKLSLRFPPLPHSSKPDFRAKPVFVLHVFVGGRDNYEFFDVMDVDDDEWEQMKASGEQFDDRIVEVVWETRGRTNPRWKITRWRDDKPNGNYIDVVQGICRSIADGVEQADLVKHSQEIRDAWKERERTGQGSTTAQLNGPPGGRPNNPQAPRPTMNRHDSNPGPSPGRPPLPPPLYTGLAKPLYDRISGPAQINGIQR